MRGFKHFLSIGGHFFELKMKASWYKAYFIPQFQTKQVKTYHAKTNVEHKGTKQQKNIVSCVANIQGVTLQLVLFHMKFVPFSKCITS